MEKEFFDWEEWDILDEGHYQFYNVVLTKELGWYPVGTKFAFGCLDYQSGILRLWTEEDRDKESPTAKFQLGLRFIGMIESTEQPPTN